MFYNGEEPASILIRLQNKVRPREGDEHAQLLIVDVDISNTDTVHFTYDLIEYDPEKDDHYLLGLTSGPGANYSLSLAPNWKKGKMISFKKIHSMKNVKIEKGKSIFESLGNEGAWIQRIFDAIGDQEGNIQEGLSTLLEREGKKIFQYPLVFRVKIVENKLFQFLGEIPAMRRLYELLALHNTQVTAPGARCRTCGDTRSLRDGFSIGLFTLDQDSFIAQFFAHERDLNYQYLMCTSCYLKTLLGYTIMQDRLSFFAYNIKAGRKKQPIFHYVIPTGEGHDQVRNAVNFIEEAKRKIAEEQGILTRQIQKLKTGTEKIKDDEIERARRAIKDLQRDESVDDNEDAEGNNGEHTEGESEENNDEDNEGEGEGEDEAEEDQVEKQTLISNRMAIIDLIKEIYQEKKTSISLLDIYYKITNAKQNPKTKVIVAEIVLSNEKINNLAAIFQEIRVNPRFKNLFIGTKSLEQLFGEHKFLQYFTAMLSYTPVNRATFKKNASKILQKLFIHNLLERKDPKTRKVLPFRQPLHLYDMYYTIFDKQQLWGR